MQRIMIVEDNADLRLDLAEQVQMIGYDPIPITDFERIIELFIEEKPDLVLLNVNLPFFDGYYWYRQIRKYSQCPIVYLSKSDHERPVNIEVALEDRKRNGNVKPYSSKILTETLRNQLTSSYPYTHNK